MQGLDGKKVIYVRWFGYLIVHTLSYLHSSSPEREEREAGERERAKKDQSNEHGGALITSIVFLQTSITERR